MKEKVPVFVDSDVIISSLLSQKGAAHLITQENQIIRYVSSLGIIEQKEVVKRLGLELQKHDQIITAHFNLIQANPSETTAYSQYTNDPSDAHIIQGAVISNAHFLATYNAKDFKIEKIKKSYNIQIIAPGQLLQYLRNR